jgi:hypothetical protein
MHLHDLDVIQPGPPLLPTYRTEVPRAEAA